MHCQDHALAETRPGRHDARPMRKKAWMVVSVAATTAAAILYRFIDLPVRVEEGIPAWRRWGQAMGEWWTDMVFHQTFGWQGYVVLAAVLALCWWGFFPPKRERRRRDAKRTTTGDVLLHDFRKLRDAYCLYHENNQDGYAASTIGLLTQKHSALLGQVEAHHDAQRLAVDFCIAALETHSHHEAMELIRERFQHPFRVRPEGRLEIQGTGRAQGEWVRPSIEDPEGDEAGPMAGIPELERCHQALVKYMAIPAQSPISKDEIAGSAELYPHMAELCRILDEQGIPRPDIDYHLTIVNTGPWAKFLGDLWAVRHDIEQARCVYQGDSGA